MLHANIENNRAGMIDTADPGKRGIGGDATAMRPKAGK